MGEQEAELVRYWMLTGMGRVMEESFENMTQVSVAEQLVIYFPGIPGRSMLYRTGDEFYPASLEL